MPPSSSASSWARERERSSARRLSRRWHAPHGVGREPLDDGCCQVAGLEQLERDAGLVPLIAHLQRDARGAARGIQHGLDARLADPLDGSVRAQHARERRCRVGTERPVRREQRLGAVDLGRQHDHGQSRALGEPERRRLEVGLSVQDDRPDRGIAGAPQREIEAVSRRLGTTPAA